VGEFPADTSVTGPTETPVETPATDLTALPSTGLDDTGSYDNSGSFDSGLSTPTEPAPEVAAPVTAPTPAPTGTVQEAAPISGTPMTLVDTASIYLILVVGAAVALLGGTVLRLMGVKLKWTS
jgi:hypothetical protein